jgi:hypothetical protein
VAESRGAEATLAAADDKQASYMERSVRAIAEWAET